MSEAHGGREPAYVYLFQHRPDGLSGAYPLAAHHSSELPFFFRVENADDEGQLAEAFRYNTSREGPLADEMASALTTFAATGRPPANWPPFEHGNQSVMLFGHPSGDRLTGSVVNGFKRSHCALWDRTTDGLDGTLDARELVHTALTLHYTPEQQIQFSADPEDDDLQPLQSPIAQAPPVSGNGRQVKVASGDSSRVLQP